MTSVRIPERYKNGLIAILALSDETVDNLISALQDAPPKVFPPSLSESLIFQLPDIPAGVLNDLIETLMGLYYTKLHHDTASDSMAEDVYNALQENDIKELRENRNRIKDRLTKLLSIERLDTLTKGLIVLRTNENVFHDARIVTEMRPIFGSDPSTGPTAAVILHVLNVSYHREGDMKEFYIALDPDDLDVLREIIDRANQKAHSLRSLLDQAKIDCLDTE